jgi:hypothetical protein
MSFFISTKFLCSNFSHVIKLMCIYDYFANMYRALLGFDLEILISLVTIDIIT